MNNVKSKFIIQAYHIFCLFAAISLTSWCIYEYSMDRDVTEIRLRKFHETKEDIHPSITICSRPPFWKEKYRSYIKNHPQLNISNDDKADAMITYYTSFIESLSNWLKGTAYLQNKSFDQILESLHGIDYDSSTLSLKDLISKFVLTVPVSSERLAYIHYDVINDTHILSNNESSDIQVYSLQELQHINTYISARQPYYKCFTIDTPMKLETDIREISIRLNTSIFSYGLSLSQFYFYLTYPKQFIRTPLGSRIVITKNFKRLPQCYKFEIHLGSMKVFKRRNKSSAPCNSDWLHHDEKEMNYIVGKVGCNPMHWDRIKNIPNCSTANQYSEINKMIYEKKEFMPPCRSIEKLAKSTNGFDLGLHCLTNNFLDLKFYLNEETFYEEVILVPAYDIQHLVGNAGGYIGISIGYSAAQAPEIIMGFFEWMKRIFGVVPKN